MEQNFTLKSVLSCLTKTLKYSGRWQKTLRNFSIRICRLHAGFGHGQASVKIPLDTCMPWFLIVHEE
jgi:hypothetical protein